MDAPDLIEPGAKHFFDCVLKSCHETRLKFNNLVLNCLLFIIFVGFFYLFLQYKKNSKINKELLKEAHEKEKRNYILKKLNIYNKNKYEKQQHLITNLPPINNDIY